MFSLYASNIDRTCIWTLKILKRALLLKCRNDTSSSTLLIEILKLSIIIFLLVICLYLWFWSKWHIRDPRCPCLLLVFHPTNPYIFLHLQQLIYPCDDVLLTNICGISYSSLTLIFVRHKVIIIHYYLPARLVCELEGQDNLRVYYLLLWLLGCWRRWNLGDIEWKRCCYQGITWFLTSCASTYTSSHCTFDKAAIEWFRIIQCASCLIDWSVFKYVFITDPYYIPVSFDII